MADTTADDDRRITRRRLLAGVGVAGASTASLAFVTDDAEAAVELGNLTVDDASATLDAPPASVTLGVSGEFEVTTNGTPEMVKSTLQVEYDGTTAELGTDATYDATQGTFAFSDVDVLKHEDLSADGITPDQPGATQTTELTIRVIVGVVSDGSLVAESQLEDTATLTVTNEGVEIALGATGSLSIDA